MCSCLSVGMTCVYSGALEGQKEGSGSPGAGVPGDSDVRAGNHRKASNSLAENDLELLILLPLPSEC